MGCTAFHRCQESYPCETHRCTKKECRCRQPKVAAPCNQDYEPYNSTFFIDEFNKVAHRIASGAHNKGFHDSRHVHVDSLQVVSDSTALMLVVTELGEVLEAIREGNPQSEKIPDYTSVEEEMADAYIRLMELSATRGWRVASAILAKMQYNTTRPHMHGGKRV
jgi:NTP pyrophosphatase (non-canonical NTP hydrolase)